MKRVKFIQHLEDHKCSMERKGKKHLLFVNKNTRLRSTVPIKPEIKNILCMKICRDLGVGLPV